MVEISPPAYSETADSLVVSLDHSNELGEVLITLTPPNEPLPGPDEKRGPKRAPVDICCVIDVSGSMEDDAPIPGEENSKERTGLCVLDVVKHAVRTIVATLDEDDRIAIVTFESKAHLIKGLTRMDKDGKDSIVTAVEALRPWGGTNLWDGLKMGMNIFTEEKKVEEEKPIPSTSQSPLSPTPPPPPPPEPEPTSPLVKVINYFTVKKKGKEAAPTAQAREMAEKSNPAAGPSEKPEKPQTAPPISTSRISSIFLLTDGCPNIEPPRGHIPMLRSYFEKHPNCSFTINTFGFGYSLDSNLLYRIAEEGSGHYGFIPDSGFVGTVFVHAGANLLATYAKCNLEIEAPGGVEVLGGHRTTETNGVTTVELGDIQYGQPKNIIVRFKDSLATASLTATARYKPWNAGSSSISTAILSSGATSPRDIDNIKYHSTRLSFVSSILSLFPHQTASDMLTPILEENATKFKELSSNIRTTLPNHPCASALAEDIDGQVLIALGKVESFKKWGCHYLPSIARAHQRQQCGNFKDAGLQVYGKESPLFTKMRDEMDAAFDTLPPPQPSLAVLPPSPVEGSVKRGPRRLRLQTTSARKIAPMSYTPVVSMALWNRVEAPCFAGHCRVAVGDSSTIDKSETTSIRVDKLRRGMIVMTPLGPRVVASIARTEILSSSLPMCKLGELIITPYHPVRVNGKWTFPIDLAEPQETSCEAVYSILLQPDDHPDAHAVSIGGVTCVTLGHGLTSATPGADEANDVRIHKFLGDYYKVLKAISVLPGFNEGDDYGVARTTGVLRSAEDGLVNGFAKPAMGATCGQASMSPCTTYHASQIL